MTKCEHMTLVIDDFIETERKNKMGQTIIKIIITCDVCDHWFEGTVTEDWDDDENN